MVTPSTSILHKIPFYDVRLGIPSPAAEKLLSRKEKHIICDAADQLLNEVGCLKEFDLDFCNGTVSLRAEYTFEDDESSMESYEIELILDILARKFFEDNKGYIEDINPLLASRIWSNTYAKDIEKISEIFYLAYERYQEQYTKEGALDSRVNGNTMGNLKPGFKSFESDNQEDVANLDILREESGEKFKKFIQTYPTSLLSGKETKKAFLFLQAGVEQKSSYEDKVIYLKQVLFLLNFQDLFKSILEKMHQKTIAEQSDLNRYPNDSSAGNREALQVRIALLAKTLSQFPVNDVVMLIPLAFRSSPDELSEHNAAFENFSQVGDEYSDFECSKAKQADMVIRDLLKKNFPEDFSLAKSSDNDGIKSINRYLMGISGLAISQGLMGRIAMDNHRTINYKSNSLVQLKSVTDNFLMEFLLAAAQFSSNTTCDWIEEKYLGYINQMMGRISTDELNDIKSNIHKLHRVIDELPVAEYLLEKYTFKNRLLPDEYLLKNNAINKLRFLCKDAREKVGLPPLQRSIFSCSIM